MTNKGKELLAGIAIGVTLVLGGGAMVYTRPTTTVNEYREELQNAKIGEFIGYAMDVDGTRLYLLMTPRGVEPVRGTSNLEWSIEVYKEKGIYGKTIDEIGK